MKFDTIIFMLDRRMAAFQERGVKAARVMKEISLKGLPQIPMIPSYCFLEESGKAADEILEEIHPYVKGFLKKQAILLCMPDDAPVYMDQKYVRDFFIRQGAGTNSCVCTMESLCQVKGKNYVTVSCSERLVTITYRCGQNQPKRTSLPLSLADPEVVRASIEGLSPEISYNETEIFILDPDEKLEEYYFLGTPIHLEKLADYAFSLAENNWV